MRRAATHADVANYLTPSQPDVTDMVGWAFKYTASIRLTVCLFVWDRQTDKKCVVLVCKVGRKTQ